MTDADMNEPMVQTLLAYHCSRPPFGQASREESVPGRMAARLERIEAYLIRRMNRCDDLQQLGS